MTDFGTFVKDNFWIPILVGAALIALIILMFYCFCRRRSRYEYEPLLYSGDIGISQRFYLEDIQKQKATKSTAEYNAQFYVRSHLAYSNVEPMEQLGSRPQKTWFRIFERNSNTHMLMSMCDAPKNLCIQFTTSTARSVKDMIHLLKYPYIYPIHDIDFMVDQGIIVVVYPICRRGSLKDFIYQCSCMDSYRVKYVSARRGLNVTQLRAFGKQILKALIYMEEKGFPSHRHVHSGNVMIDNNSCRLMGIEDCFMGHEPRQLPLLKRYIRKKPEAMDVVSFGHLLFEMCLGRELETAQPQPADLNRCESKSPDIVEVMNFIFPSDKKSFPSLSEVAEHRFFQDVPLPALEQFSLSAISLNREMRNIVKALRKGVPAKKKSKWKNVQRSTSEDNQQSISISTAPPLSAQAPPLSGTAPPPYGQVPPTPAGAPPPPPPRLAPPPPPSLAPPPPAPPGGGALPLTPNSGGRSALLGDIRKGMKLKKAQTNDRSAPKV